SWALPDRPLFSLKPPLPRAARIAATAILLGAVGGPAWPRPVDPADPSKGFTPRPEEGLLALRKELNLYANLRPCNFASQSLVKNSPLKEEIVQGVGFTVIRELVGGVYFGRREEEDEQGNGGRIARLAGQMAMQSNPPLPIHSIDKANVLATSRLWRRVVTETIKKEFPSVLLDHQLVDAAAMHLVRNPRSLNGIVLTENLFGDILSDEASVIPGSLGLLPSASLAGMPSEEAGVVAETVALYEPIHGSAPDIAGRGVANPVGTILSAAMMLRYSLGMPVEADLVEAAVRTVLDEKPAGMGLRTRDLGGDATTVQMGDAIVAELKKLL
ncbi:MAG: 3-isopropylmalate dehydrogenase, partial [Olpidium bornovanus]